MQYIFCNSFKIQIRVIGALMRREMIVFYGRKGFGFFMIFLEPLIIMTIVMFFLIIRRVSHYSSSFPLYAFIFSGWSIMWLCRYPLRKVGRAIAANRSFLYYKNIRPLDILVSRVLLLLFGVSTSFWLLFVLFYSLMPIYDFLYIFLAVVLTYWYSFFLAIFVSTVSTYFPGGEFVTLVFNVLHLFVTGAFFMVDWLSAANQQLALLSPMVHVTEMLRYGFFGNVVTCYFDTNYIILCNLMITFSSLAVTRYCYLNMNIYDKDQ